MEANEKQRIELPAIAEDEIALITITGEKLRQKKKVKR